MSLASRFTELPSSVSVPPSSVANERGSITLDGAIPRFWHQLSSTGSRLATIGVLGTTPEIGATTRPSNPTMRLGLRMRSDAISSRSRSSAPLRNMAAETANKPIRVISAGLPNPLRACIGVSTPPIISRDILSSPTSSGAIAPLMNSTTASNSTARVI
ncbi:MAG: Uncharacterised protein [Cyanobium sp. ARS6]|nr:MAG: Uncharacterised protein [Cyanobium sp. ARS6]